MAWVTEINADEQVDYRLSRQAGCGVVAGDGRQVEAGDGQVDYRLESDADGVLVWVGSGLDAVGLTAGTVMTPEGEAAARRLMKGCHPTTGARLITTNTSVRADPKATLTVAPLLRAIEAKAAEEGVEPAALLDGKPKQQKVLAQQQRMVRRKGEAQRLHVETVRKLARAAGVDLEAVYGRDAVEFAAEHKDLRVDSRVRGWDLVLDLTKSDSTLDGLMPDLDERTYREIVHQAKDETLRMAEQLVGYAVASEDGEPVRIATGGLLGWSVEHRAARPMGDGQPGDPHLHLHVVIANMALCEDGKWRSIANSGRDLYRHAAVLDAVFKARVRQLTYERFGVRRVQSETTRAWEIEGIPEQLRDAFSRRGALVNAAAGEDASLEDRMRVSAATRRAKHTADATGMRASWRQRAEALGIDVDAMVAEAAPGPPGPDGGAVGGPGGGPRIPPPSDVARIVFDPETGVTASKKAFTRAELMAAVANALPYGFGSADLVDLQRLVDDVLRVEGYAVALPHVGSTVMSSTDRYTTRDILDAEELVISQALARVDEGAVQLTAEQAAAAMSVFEVANGFALSDEQRAAITRTLTAGLGIEAHVGAAGTGKSTLMEACRIAWDATGHTYAGATVSAVAAKSLADASGIPARSIASWLQQIRDGNGLTGIDVLVVDEATMSNDRQAAALFKEAARTGTKIVAIGDPKQLQAIGPGGWFREVHRLVGGLTLTENRRQRNAAERAALEVWRTGDHEQALRILADTGRVHATESAIEAHEQILTTWDELRGRWSDPHDLIDSLTVLAAKNTDVDLLNLGAQQIRRQRGELGAEHRYALSGGADLNLAVGDLVRVRQNDYRSRRGEGPDVLNGYRAVVTAIDEAHRVEIAWRDKTTNDIVSAWFDPQAVSSGALSLGYAMTVAASQGLTSEVSLLYGHGANAFAVYPGITRGRAENHLWLPLQVVEDAETQARLGAARTETERLQRAVTAFAKFLGQDRGDSMVSDLLREPPAPAVRVPQQAAVREHELAREESEAALRRAQAATAVSPGHAHQAQEEAQRAAAEAQADTAAADDVAVQLQPATEDDARERTASEKRLAEVQRRRETASVQSWKSRPYGKRSDADLARVIGLAYERAGIAERGAAQTAEKARALEERLAREKEAGQTRGQAFVAAAATLLDQAEAKAQEAAQQLALAANARKEAEERDRYLRDSLEPKKDWGRLERLRAGVTKKQIAAEIADVTAERAAWRSAQSEARSAADAARVQAWEMIRTSEFAGQFRDVDAQQAAPDDVATVTERLAKMREQLPDIEIRLDRRDAQTLTRLQGEVTQYTDAAAKSRKTVAAGQAEQALRKTIATRYPELHEIETRARRSYIVAQQRAAAEQSRARAQESAGYHRQWPSQGRGGPSMPGR
ncbi:MobF family relaxase [Streptomyces sp. CSDS2]|uniref:MobF family relaxase n=1 Tax=Streptomyces sp. CSDS2 TaxID=3055051 RepID=UPI0025AF9550|nr:MobF family relaxase [Streptomyces sp. CSDS2]MDN3262890.1 MobF family relaxase [Streptomyces sp. CSDS2]